MPIILRLGTLVKSRKSPMRRPLLFVLRAPEVPKMAAPLPGAEKRVISPYLFNTHG